MWVLDYMCPSTIIKLVFGQTIVENGRVTNLIKDPLSEHQWGDQRDFFLFFFCTLISIVMNGLESINI